MSVTFHPLKVKNIRRETPECVSVAFDVPESLKPEFRFRHGQYLTFRKRINEEEVRRSYSICSSPHEEELRVAIKQVDEGVFSSYINNELKIGEELDVMAPQGLFTCELDEEQSRHYVAFAAGSGITPILSIIKTILYKEPESSFTLVYGNKTRGTIIFKAELEALKNKFMERLSIYHVLSREQADAALLSGRIDKKKCSEFLDKLIDPKLIDHCFLCGPEDMIMGVKEGLVEAGVPGDHIHYELFFSTTAAQKQKERQQQASSNDPVSQVTIRLDGSAVTIPLGYNGDNILDAALKNGADLPFACKGGVCATCRAKLEEGEVDMDVNYALEKDELAAGFILTCQSHPRSEKVVVNFDIR